MSTTSAATAAGVTAATDTPAATPLAAGTPAAPATATSAAAATAAGVTAAAAPIIHPLAAQGFYAYTVLPGDSWPVVAQRTGISIHNLQAANPQAIRPNGWLATGEKLAIPVPVDPQTGSAPSTMIYTVQPGDSWSSISEQFGIRIILLQAVNADSVRQAGILRIGEEILIPPPPPPPGAQMPALPTPPSTPRAPMDADETTEPTAGGPVPDFLPVTGEGGRSTCPPK
jgi:LysM repeat protein